MKREVNPKGGEGDLREISKPINLPLKIKTLTEIPQKIKWGPRVQSAWDISELVISPLKKQPQGNSSKKESEGKTMNGFFSSQPPSFSQLFNAVP